MPRAVLFEEDAMTPLTNRPLMNLPFINRWMNRFAIGLLLVSCAAGALTPAMRGADIPPCDPNNAGITLPAGFCAFVAADGLGAARHMAVAANGDLYVALMD